MLEVIHLHFVAHVHEGQSTSELECLEEAVAHLGLADFFMVFHGIGLHLTLDLVFEQCNGHIVFHVHLPAVHGSVCQLGKVVLPLVNDSTVGRLDLASIDLGSSHGVKGFAVLVANTKEATAGVSGFQERVEFVLGDPTIEQLGRRTEQQHVGGSLAVNFLAAHTVRGVLGQLLLGHALVIQFQEQVQHFNLLDQIGANLVNLQVDGAAVGQEQFMAQLLHSRGCAAVECERISSSLVELGVHLVELSLWIIGSVLHCTVVGDVPQVLFSNCRHRVLHEATFETGQELVLHDAHGVALTKARSGQGKCVDVHRDFATIFGHDRGTHDGGHLAEEVGDFSTEEALVCVLGLVAEHIHNLVNNGMMSNAGQVCHGKYFRACWQCAMASQ